MDEMTVEKEEVGALTLRVVQDVYIEYADPRENDCNLGVMVCGHRDYDLGDVQVSEGAADDYGTVKNWLIAEHDAIAETIMPLYLFDHSGISISTDASAFAVWDSAGWDWGTVGFVFATPKTVEETGAPEDSIREQLVNEVSEYDSYLRGDVFTWIIEDADGKVLESCGGYVGEPDYALSEARGAVEYLPEYRREVVGAFAGSNGLGL
jgi:hypothetical protein